MSCTRAQEFLAKQKCDVATEQNATKDRIEGADVLDVLHGKSTLVVAKSKKIQTYDLTKDRPSDEDLVAAMTGPTGNLRAPTFVVGQTVVVGYNAKLYGDVL